MKKILLMLAMLLPCVGVWAEVAPLKVSTDAQKYYYVIKNLRSGKYAYYNGDNSDIKQKVAPTSSEEVNNYIWYLTADGENYKLHNLGTQYTYAAVNSFTPAGTTVYIEENPYREGYVVISKNATVTTANTCWDDQDRYQAVGKVGWYEPRSNDNEGTSWTFIELDAATETQYTITDEVGNSFIGSYDCCVFNGQKSLPRTKDIGLKNVVWTENTVSANVSFPIPVSSETATNPTLIVNGASWTNPNNRKWRATTDNGVNYVKAQTAEVNNNSVDALWVIYPVLSNGCFTYKVKSLKTNTFVTADPNAVGNAGNGSDVTGATKRVSLTEEGTAFEYKLRTGSNYQFTYVNASGTELRLSMNGSSDTDVFLGVYSGSHSGNDIAFPDYVTELTFPFTVSSARAINPIMIASFNDKAYTWHAEGSNIKVTKNVAATNENITTHLWTIYPVFSNEGCKYQIKNLGTGSYVYSTSSANSHNEGTVTLSETGTLFSFESDRFKLSTGKCLSLNSTSGKDGSTQTVGTWDGHSGCNIAFPTTTYSLTVGSTGYASLYTLFAGTFAGEVKTYAIESASNSSAELTEKNGVAANQGAIVVAAPGTYTFTAGAVASDWANNQLLGSAVNTYVEGEAYVLALVDGNAALTLAELNKDANGETGDSHFLNNAGKAYLPASVVNSNAQALRFNFGGTTGIEETIVAPVFNANAPIYDLSGRRVMNTTKGGIYIQNGKKFIVK